MLSHLSLGTRDLARACAFYDAALAPLGHGCVWRYPTAAGYGPPGGSDRLALFERAQASPPGPGFHLALRAPSREAVHAFHAAALAHGGADDGQPGPRPQYSPTYYAAFVVDPDGHRIEVVHQ